MDDVCFYITHYAASKTYKFFFLADKLRERGVSVEIILCNTEMSGIRSDEISGDLLNKFSRWNVKIKSKREMYDYVLVNKYKYFVVGCYSGDISNILSIVRKNGAKVVEIATIGFNDPIEHNADINLLISEMSLRAAINKRPKRAKKAKNIRFVGSLFSDDIPNTYTSELNSIDSFKEKYKTGDKRIFIWMPGRDDMQDIDFQKRLFDKFPKSDCLLMTTHPWTEKYQQKCLLKIKKSIKHVNSNDVYWAFKAMTCGIARNSTSGIEMCVMRKPVLYIGNFTRRPYIANKMPPVGFVIKSVNILDSKIRHLNFNIPEDRYLSYINTIYPTPYIPAWQRIRNFFVESMCIKTSV